MSKIIQIATTRGAGDIPVMYALFDDGTVKCHNFKYGWYDVPEPKNEQDLANRA